MATESRYDVVIVGARCAGATLATFLARAGASVLLLDKDRLPSDQILSTTRSIRPVWTFSTRWVSATQSARWRRRRISCGCETRPSSTSSFPMRERSTVPAGRGSTVSCRTRQRQRESRSLTERG